MEEFLKLFFETLFKEKEEISLEKHPLVDIKILKKIDYKRYEIVVKKRKMICASHIAFDIGSNYWGKVYKDKYGIVTISNLKKEPKFFQNSHFASFNMPFSEILFAIKEPKRYIILLNKQSHIKNILPFRYCYENGILSFPLYINEEIMLLQFKPNKNKNRIKYYFAFKNFGEFNGVIENSKVLINAENSIRLKGFNVKVVKDITPLCELENSILNIKG